MVSNLTDDNFMLFAARHYENPVYDDQEFHDDLKRIKYLKRLFNKYDSKDELKERLILNHIIILCNVFGPAATTKMLFLKLEEYTHFLKPFLLYLGYLPEELQGINGETIIVSDIRMDEGIIQKLRGL